MQRVMIIGNGGGGKSLLARHLARAKQLPLHHVDSIQFRSGWVRTPPELCQRELDRIAAGQRWVLDGFGPRASIEHRLERADTIVFVDLPLAVHYWRALGRQLRSRRQPRAELPSGCPEHTLAHTRWLIGVMWRVHREFRPWFRSRLDEAPRGARTFHLRSRRDLEHFGREHAGVSLAAEAGRAKRAAAGVES